MKNVLWILFVIGIDSFLENYYRIFYSSLDYYGQMDIWNQCQSVRNLLAFIWCFMIAIARPKSDTWDKLLFLSFIIFQGIDMMDWFWNFNQRDDTQDWEVFITVMMSLIFFKYLWYRKAKANVG